MFKCSVCYGKLSDTAFVWIGVCGHFCCEKCSEIVDKVPDKYDFLGETHETNKFGPSTNVKYNFCKCGRVFEIVDDSAPTSLDKAIHLQQNIVLLNVKESLSEFKSYFNEIDRTTSLSRSSLENIETNTSELVDTMSRIEKIFAKVNESLMATTTLQEQVRRLEEKIANIEGK